MRSSGQIDTFCGVDISGLLPPPTPRIETATPLGFISEPVVGGGGATMTAEQRETGCLLGKCLWRYCTKNFSRIREIVYGPKIGQKQAKMQQQQQ